MDFKKIRTETTVVTRQKDQFYKGTGNIYETVAILTKRANQIASEMKEELNKKIEEFATNNDSLEEVFENREQIEIAKFYERLPKPTLIAIHEFLNDEIYFRNPRKETQDEF
ncbi:MAG: DNA-directed RNA polymerase subunit omega [Bacteroidales bacterium]|jgi:DNA-directed RNA polymerase subunit K/omega|nr:DNA-directed RNA polymerase subunit omega [Bacteroidales bacterium]MBQ3354921.1 DNA-directed RNA polymerase subunit omega [Bacteroidales bacterium]MBR6848191.1 DNA-directed RNA polymerase subunit omega [Bacteroidales bacterium]